MADIFDEINEDLKRDQMQQLWSRYGKYVIIAVSLVVIGVGTRQGYTAWQDRQATEAATIYHQALKADDTASALAAQLETLSPGYVMLAQFRIAATQAENKDFWCCRSKLSCAVNRLRCKAALSTSGNLAIDHECASKP